MWGLWLRFQSSSSVSPHFSCLCLLSVHVLNPLIKVEMPYSRTVSSLQKIQLQK